MTKALIPISALAESLNFLQVDERKIQRRLSCDSSMSFVTIFMWSIV